jgi:hypothetical protein
MSDACLLRLLFLLVCACFISSRGDRFNRLSAKMESFVPFAPGIITNKASILHGGTLYCSGFIVFLIWPRV